MGGLGWRTAAGASLAVLWMVAGCGGTGGATDDVLGDVVIITPGTDEGRDPGLPDAARDPGGLDAAPDPAADLPDPGTDEGAPADAPDPAADLAPRDLWTPPDESPADAPPDASPPDLPADPGPADPGPVDAGTDLVGACAPGSLTCRCEDDIHCNPAYSEPCRPNRCNLQTNRCVLDSGYLEGLECEDGDFCTTGETCQKGNCKGGTETCECRLDAQCADDGNPCTAAVCDRGTCVHGPVPGPCADDGNPCTAEACDQGVCTHPPAAGPCADDGNPCTADLCDAGACTHPPAAGPCADDGNPCTDDLCDAGACAHPANAAPCDDGDGCTVGDACAAGSCAPGTRVCQCDGDARCDDGIPCTDDRCLSGDCAHGLAADTCLVDGACVAAATPQPGNACRACDPAAATDAWSPVADGTPCADADPCTDPDACAAGACVPGPRVCECADASWCDDGNPCTDDACVSFACTHVANALPCEDGDPATLGDRCAASACVPGIPCGDGTCNRPAGESCATCPADCLGPCPATEVRCADGWDDDLDGLTDCGDTSDCRFDAACLPPNACSQIDDTVACGFDLSYDWSLGNSLAGTACGLSLGGDDTIWRFTSPTTRSVTFRIDDPSSSDTMSAIVLAGSCNGLACLKAATGDPAIVTFTAEAGRTYYLVYDEVVYMAAVRARVTCN